MTSIQTQVYFLCLIGHIYTTDTCYQPISLQPCGGRWLDSQLEFCCNNVPHSIDSNQCCCIDTISGTQVLHTKDQICCGGQLFNKTDSFGIDQNCCGPEVVRESDKTKMCCYPPTPKTTQSGPLPRLYHYHRDRYPFWENASCCSNSIIDKTTQKCCNNKINEITMDTSNWHCCNQTAYDDRSHYCDKGDPNNHTVKLYIIDHCDGIPFYKHLNTCCDGVLYPYHDKRNYECCGNQIRNLMTEQCCTESSRVISRSRLCCGSFPTGIDGATHVCCPHPRNSSEKLVLHKKAPQARQCCGYSVYNNDLEFCCMGKPYPRSDYQRCARQCCGYSVYNNDLEFCCMGKPYPRSDYQRCARQCCGYSVYNNDLEFCCMGKPYPRSDYQRCGTDNECVLASHQEECCGVQKFTWDNYTCCDRKLVTVKTASSQDKCCYNDRNGTGKSYASITQDCVRGEVKPKAKRCGHGKYNDSSDLCCDYNLYRGVLDLDKDNKCCGSNFYNNKTQQCCSFKVVNGTQCPDPSQNITCHLCAKNRREVAEKIENGELDSAICALKLAYVAVVHRQIVDYDNQTMKYVIQRPSRNLFNRRLEIRHKYLLLPWVCKKNFSRIIVVTSNPGKKARELSCYERDILLPYSKRIKQAVTMRKYFCLKLY